MIRVYIDESGNLGRGGKYFVLAAAVFDTPQGAKRASRIVHNFQGKMMKTSPLAERREIKSCRLTLPERQNLLNKLVSKADIDIFYLAVDKQRVTLLKEGKPKNLVYNYFAKLLTDSIFTKYNDDYLVIFDQRTTAVKSMNSLTDYITINAYTSHQLSRREVEVRQKDSHTENNLQIADLIAGTIFQAYTRQNRHFLNLLQQRIVAANEFPHYSFSGSLINTHALLTSSPTMLK